MALRELSSLEKFLGLKKLNKYSMQGERKVISHTVIRSFILGNSKYLVLDTQSLIIVTIS